MYLNLKLKSFLLSLLLLLSVGVFAQKSGEDDDDKKNHYVQEALDYIINSNDDGLSEDNVELIFLSLSDFVEDPINLNSKDLSELKSDLENTQLLTSPQIMALLSHRDKNGKLMNIYELQTLQGWDAKTIKRVLPFVLVTDNTETTKIPLKELFANGKHTITLRTEYQLETEDGNRDYFLKDVNGKDSLANEYGKLKNKKYLGTRPKFYSRYNFAYGNKISFGFTGEKDRGEEFFKGTQKFGKDTLGNFNTGFDFFSYHLYMSGVGKIGTTGINIKKVALGDYNAAFGQGLTFFSGYGAFKSPATPIEISARSRGLSKYAGSGDFFLRGGATTLEYENVEATIFYSNRKLDATLATAIDTSTNEEQIIDANLTNVFHNTTSSLAKRKTIRETVIGGNLKVKLKKLTLGATVAKTKFDNKLGDKTGALYDDYRFQSSDNLLNMGVDYTYLYKNMTFFGELSRSSQESDSIDAGYAMIHGVMASVSSKFSLALVYRDFGLKYQHLAERAEVLSHNSSNKNNEKSIYFGTSSKLHKKVTFNTYVENAYYPYASSSSKEFSVARAEFSSQLTYLVKRRWEIYTRYRNRVYDEIISDTRVARRYNQFRVNSKYSPGNGFSMASRAEVITNVLKNSYDKIGYVIYQDINWKNSNWRSPFKAIHVHYALYGGTNRLSPVTSSGTPSSGEATYTYERGVAFGTSPGAFGSGSRIIVMGKFQIIRGMKFNILFSQWYRSDKDHYSGSPGSINYIEQPTKSRVDAQLVYKF